MENQTQPVALAVSDLIMLQNVVELAAERGAFRAEEMSSIGQCYDKLRAWLAQMKPPSAPDETPPDDPAGQI